MSLKRLIIIYTSLSCCISCIFTGSKEEIKFTPSNQICFLYRYTFSEDSNFSGLSRNSWLYKMSISSNFENGISQAIESANQECKIYKSAAGYREISIKVIMTQQDPDEIVELKKNVLALLSAASLFLIPHWSDYYYELSWKVGVGSKCEKTFNRKEKVTLYVGFIYLFVPWKWDSALISTPVESKFYKQTLDIISEYETMCKAQI
ncbi:hypothetical protein AYB33_17390 [Leptospira santarosai]|uniref:hypothetical protein n=1 Tax=Leptospira santarosai TaxID=28183 RepID=UPI000778203A|nr:hypothetical protein [Leptospira santarosai]KXZ29471.1 hypothetical protein AYB33_17390 [Leptospira santarosai]